jgi:hypothetical protein
VEGGKIGLARLGTQAGELGNIDTNSEVAVGLGIIEGFEALAG